MLLRSSAHTRRRLGSRFFARTLPRVSSPLRPSGRSVGPSLQFCVAASRISFYIRFSSFMILHKLIQLDNQREKLTQVS